MYDISQESVATLHYVYTGKIIDLVGLTFGWAQIVKMVVYMLQQIILFKPMGHFRK